jgi:hypothetical protein
MVSYVFKHDSSSRRLVGSFKDFDSAKKSKLKTNMEAGDRFELHKIILATSPRDLLVLKRNQISGASGFDFDLLNDGPEASDGGGNTPSVVSFELFQNYPTYSPSVDPTSLTRTENGIYSSLSIATSKQSLGALSSGVGSFDVTFNFEDLSDTSGRGTYFGILFSDVNPNSLSLSEIASNYETSSYLFVTDSTSGMGAAIIGTSGFQSAMGVSGSAKSIRILQDGNNQVKLYQDGNLIHTFSVSNVSKLYAYPFVRSQFQHTLTSAVAVAVTSPASSSTYINYNINPYNYIVSPTGGVTSGSVFYGDDQFIKSSINESVGDFEYQWDFNWTGINARNMLLGITTSGGSLWWYENLSCFEGTGVNTYRLWVGASAGVVTGSLSAGNHTFRLVRTGTTLYYYLDNVLIYSGGSVSGTAQPTVRAYPSNVACTESKEDS